MQPLDEEMLADLAKEPAVIEGHPITNLEPFVSFVVQHICHVWASMFAKT